MGDDWHEYRVELPNFQNDFHWGPLDMAYLLKFIEVDLLGDYDNLSPYPNRDTLIHMLQDLSISFGNPIYYNPASTLLPPKLLPRMQEY
jgi:hypothetical protein